MVSKLSTQQRFVMTIWDCIEQGLLRVVFQPIGDLRSGGIVGYEGLIRGPRGSPLEMPQVLFEQAYLEGCSIELECAAARVCLSTFSEKRLAGKLFVNFGADSIRRIASSVEALRDVLAEYATPADRVVFELTEQANPEPLDTLAEAIQVIKDAGAQLALDDFGHGNANFNLWIALRPNYIKLGRAIVDGVSTSDFKYEVLRTMEALAAYSDATLIAEGLEEMEDLLVCRDAGIPLAQGFLLGRPAVAPLPEMDETIFHAIRGSSGPKFGQRVAHSAKACRCPYGHGSAQRCPGPPQ